MSGIIIAIEIDYPYVSLTALQLKNVEALRMQTDGIIKLPSMINNKVGPIKFISNTLTLCLWVNFVRTTLS